MNTTELSAHLRDATDGLTVRPDFADAVLRGGRRRRARRRLTIAASVLAVAAVAATATVVTQRDDEQVPVADARLTMPTKGDLAGDQSFLDEARRAWEEGLPSAPEARDRYYDDPKSAPHVYWAGNTPAGRAAIVLQEVYVHPNSQVTVRGPRTAEGLVAIDPLDGRLKLVNTRMIGIDVPGQAAYFKFGPDDRTVLVVDRGEPLHYDAEPTYVEKDRAVRYDWHRIEPRDGVAIVPVPEDEKPQSMIVYEGSNPPEQLSVGRVPTYPTTASLWLTMRLPDPAYRLRSDLLAWGRVLWRLGEPLGTSDEALEGQVWGYYPYYPSNYDAVVSLWTIAARLPDGRVVVLKQRQDDGAAPRLVAEIAADVDATTTVRVDGGPVDKDAVLPVRFRIPDGGGWIVADKGKELSYRTAPDAPWQKAGRDAALLPANATEVLAGEHFVRL